MLNQQDNLFYQTCAKVANKVYLEELMSKQQCFFDIQPFKIEKLYSQTAKKIYNLIRFKYEISKQYILNPTFWYENQRKIFIWFIVCFFHQNQLQSHQQSSLDWTLLSDLFFHKNIAFLQFQFKNILKQKQRISWTQTEDQFLIKATQQEGSGCWNQISKNLFFTSGGKVFKSPKHCRQRWLNHLDKSKNKGKWTDEQDFLMLTYIKQTGKKWSKISQLLNHTRTQHMVKNRYNSLMTKVRRNKKQKQVETINKILQSFEQKQIKNMGQHKWESEVGKGSCQINSNRSRDEIQQQKLNELEEQKRPSENRGQKFQNQTNKKEDVKNPKYRDIDNPKGRGQIGSNYDKKTQPNFRFFNFFVQLPMKDRNLPPGGMMFYYHVGWPENDKLALFSLQPIDPLAINFPSPTYKTQPVHIIQHNKSCNQY